MKRFFILIIVTTAWLTSLFAVTEQDAKAYFQRCILSLDPIEGCYSVEYRGQGESVFGSAWSSFAETSLRPDVYIVKMNEERDGRFLVCLGDTKQANWQYYWVLERIGTTNAYKFLVYNKNDHIIQSCHVYMEDNLRFVVNFNRMDAGGYTSAMDGSTYVGVQGYGFQLSFVKSFPSAEMYASAKREEIKENYAYNSGTAFALNDGYFATNYHIYEGKKYAIAKGLNNNTYRAYYIAGDETNDIAIFQIRDNNFTGFDNIPYSVASSTADIGEEVWTLGFPQTNLLGDEIKYTKGEISALSGSSSDGNTLKTNDIRLYQITTPITNGNSGGPLFDESGQLIGITSSGWGNNMNYAIKSHLLIALMESAGLRNVIPSRNQLKGEKQKEQIKKVKPCIFQVVCYDNKELEVEFFKASVTEEKSENEAKDPVASQTTSKDIKMPCDSIITIEGKLVLAKIINAAGSNIQYQDLMTDEKDTKIIAKSQVQLIIFANGALHKYNTSLATDSNVADETPKEISLRDKVYYLGEKPLSQDEYMKLIKSCDEAWDQYNTRMHKTGIGVMCGAGVGLMIIGGATYTAESVAGILLMSLSAVTITTGAVFTIIGFSKKKNAYKEYNASCAHKTPYVAPDQHINLQICQNGIGLSFTF